METVKDCHYPWTWMMVASNGNVTPCCFSSGTLGNLQEESADKIWNGPVAVELRSFILQDKIHPVCANAPCKFVQNMKPALPEAMEPIPRQEFNEEWYLANHPDIVAAIASGFFSSGWEHYVRFGVAEGRTAKRS